MKVDNSDGFEVWITAITRLYPNAKIQKASKRDDKDFKIDAYITFLNGSEYPCSLRWRYADSYNKKRFEQYQLDITLRHETASGNKSETVQRDHGPYLLFFGWREKKESKEPIYPLLSIYFYKRLLAMELDEYPTLKNKGEQYTTLKAIPIKDVIKAGANLYLHDKHPVYYNTK